MTLFPSLFHSFFHPLLLPFSFFLLLLPTRQVTVTAQIGDGEPSCGYSEVSCDAWEMPGTGMYAPCVKYVRVWFSCFVMRTPLLSPLSVWIMPTRARDFLPLQPSPLPVLHCLIRSPVLLHNVLLRLPRWLSSGYG